MLLKKYIVKILALQFLKMMFLKGFTDLLNRFFNLFIDPIFVLDHGLTNLKSKLLSIFLY